jgi:hypothetical protein
MTNFFEPFVAHGYEKAVQIEVMQGENLARAASKTTTLKHYIWSTLPNGEKLTSGKWKIPHIAAKNMVDDFIKQDEALLQKTTFLWIAPYATNFQYPVFTPNFLVRDKFPTQMHINSNNDHRNRQRVTYSCPRPQQIFL